METYFWDARAHPKEDEGHGRVFPLPRRDLLVDIPARPRGGGWGTVRHSETPRIGGEVQTNQKSLCTKPRSFHPS